MTDLTAEGVTWDLEPLVDGRGEEGVDDLLERALAKAKELTTHKGRVEGFTTGELAAFMNGLADIRDLVGRAGSYASLRYAADTIDPANGALLQKVQERSTEIDTMLVFFEIEWAAVDDDRVSGLLAGNEMEPFRHFLENQRRYKDHLLTESEERILSEKAVTGRNAWTRLFSELTSTLEVDIDGDKKTFEEGLSLLQSPERSTREKAAGAITEALAPGLKTRTFLFNTVLYDKAVDDRLRDYPHWLASRNLANETDDASVRALVDAVRKRYEIPRRWYRLKAKVLGIDKLADFDRVAVVATEDVPVGWAEATEIVLDSYASFSEELADLVRRFLAEGWIDAPARPGKRPGAFCSYTVPSHHPYVFLNFTATRNDVQTLAHELGHGVHAALSRPRGVFHHSTPLTLAETASVFGETVTTDRLLSMTEDPQSRFELLASDVERAIATVFRQVAMNGFEDAVHNARRTEGELSTSRINELWLSTQTEMMADSVELTDGYATWWSYVPHFIGVPGYVYAYAYGQLLALSVYKRYQDEGSSFVPSYLELLKAGGSMTPVELGKIVGCDLTDPGFWDGGLDIVEEKLQAAEAAAAESSSLTR